MHLLLESQDIPHWKLSVIPILSYRELFQQDVLILQWEKNWTLSLNKWFFEAMPWPFKTISTMRTGDFKFIWPFELERLGTSRHHNSGDDRLNPADDFSWGLGIIEFLKNEHWLRGPLFLYSSEDHYTEPKFENIAVQKLEIKKEVYVTIINPTTSLNCLLTRFSSGPQERRKKIQTHARSHGISVMKKLRNLKERLSSWYWRASFCKR